MVTEKLSFIKLAGILTLIADASLILRKGIIKPYTLQPFECLIILAFISLLIGLYQLSKTKDLIFLVKKYSLPFVSTFVLFIVGSVLAYHSFLFTHDSVLSICKDIFLLCTVYIGFLLHLYFGRTYDFRNKAIQMMSISILFIVFLLFPLAANTFGFLGNGDSFVGLQNNQNVLSSFLLIPFSYLLLKTFNEKVVVKKIVYWLGIIASSSLLLWTGSRGSWFAALIITALFTLVHIYKTYSKNFTRILRLLCMTVVVIFSLITSYVILPHNTKIMILDRFFPSITNGTINPFIINNTSLFNALSITQQSEGSIPYQNRQNIWPKATTLLIHHPFGLGPEYARISQALHEDDGRWTLAHNTLLQAGLSGGWLLLLLTIAGLVYMTKVLYSLSRDTEGLLYTGIFLGIVIIMQLNDFLFVLPWFWILVALILTKKESLSQ